MKKIIVSAVFIFMVLSGVVSGSSINGEYKGNPIVKLKSNGKVLPVEDTPPIIYDGRTLVPIYMLKELGADVQWDAETYSVDVKLNKTSDENEDGVTEDDIVLMKLLSKITEQYRIIHSTGEIIKSVGQILSEAYFDIEYRDKIDKLTAANMRLNQAIDFYNQLINNNEIIIEEASKRNIDITKIRTIMDQYNKAIDYYKRSYAGLDKFSYSKENNDFYIYLDNSKYASESVGIGISSAMDSYYKFYNLIQNY